MESLSKAQKLDRIKIIIIPIVIMAIFGVLTMKYLVVDKDSLTDRISTIIGLLSDFWGVYLGFDITILSIIITMNDNNSYIKLLKETNHYSNIVFSHLITGLYVFIALVFILSISFLGIENRCIYCFVASVAVGVFGSIAMSLYLWIIMIFNYVN